MVCRSPKGTRQWPRIFGLHENAPKLASTSFQQLSYNKDMSFQIRYPLHLLASYKSQHLLVLAETRRELMLRKADAGVVDPDGSRRD